jgi:hypothetical protein
VKFRIEISRLYLAVIIIILGILGLSHCSSPEPEEKTTILLATKTRPLRDVHFESTPARIQRGEYLANSILKCMLCHSPRDTTKPGYPPIESMKGGGAILTESKESRIVAPNLTPDKKTGAGTWTDDMFARAIREGIGHDGRALSLPMYWQSFRDLSDEDLASVVVYLRTLPPVKNKLPGRKFSAEREKELQTTPMPLPGPVKSQDLKDPLTRGRYLVKVADCVGCHTSWYKRNPGFFGGGNRLRKIYDTSFTVSTNITPHSTGLLGWTSTVFINVIRGGKNGTLDPLMPWISYKNLYDEDLEAILLALKQVPPVDHKVVNGIEPSYCEVCDQIHGYGKYNKIAALKALPFDSSLYREFAGTYTHRLGFSIEVSVQNNKLMIAEGDRPLELVHVGNGRFAALGFSTPVSFKRDSSGKVIGLISYWIEEDLFDKQPPKRVVK